MLGMFVKDFYIMRNQGKILFVFILISLVMVVTKTDFITPVGLSMMVFPLFSISTIGYDEYDNGFSFLMTLPNSKKAYVVSKYLFASLAGIIAMILMTVFVFVPAVVMDRSIDSTEFFKTMITLYLVSQGFVSLYIPINFKFGSEKGRYAMIILFFLLGFCGYFFFEILSVMNIDILSIMAVNTLTSEFVVLLFMTVVCVVIYLISMLMSIHIMQNKEF